MIMKKGKLIAVSLSLALTMLTGCGTNAATKNNNTAATTKSNTATTVTTNNTVKTGLGVVTSIAKSTDAGEKDGLAEADSTIAAVTVDKDGKIVKCVIDSVQTKVNFTKEGKLKTDVKTAFKSKNELKTDYGMGKASGIKKEWNEQAAAFSAYVVGKTVDQVKGIAVNEKGAPKNADLSSSVTISVGDFITVIEKAVKNAQDLGAKADDKLGLGTSTNIEKSADAGDKDGLAQPYSYYTASTFSADGKVTSCVIDASQANINFNKSGKITTDLKAPIQSKNELKENYGMKKASKIGKEWYEQAAAFAKYATGKTVSQIKGIAVNEKGAATNADLTSSVTVGIKDFQSIIEKASASAK